MNNICRITYFIFGFTVGLVVFYPDLKLYFSLDTNLYKLILKPEFISAFATILLAVITYMYVKTTNKILENQLKPEINISTYNVYKNHLITNALIKNVGNSVAFNISFCVENDNLYFTESKKLRDLMLFNQKINSLNPGDERIVQIGLQNSIVLDEEIKVEIFYENASSKKYKNVNYVNLKGYRLNQDQYTNITGGLANVTAKLGDVAITISSLATEIRKNNKSNNN